MIGVNVLMHKITSLISRVTSNFFLRGGVRYLVQTIHKLPNRPTNAVTTLVLVTKKKN